MKKYLNTTLVVVILVMVILNAWKDGDEMHSRHKFFDEVRGFMQSEKERVDDLLAFKNKGGRNTAVQGKALCERVNRLEQMLGETPSDCAALYGVE
jgi:hypothetical protein